ncbi:MAG: tetratricopeptide repeat protein [Calditrichaeota bacterium]|nr:MAG: tetratricopeptide repeat protein [Calditrichota bacterium]MBL1205965.1 tetratricopeptide repeat protein [Calditrichota bacterium]NOG45793.1 PorV/PorQ family protein [Calditrichota bacterium]
MNKNENKSMNKSILIFIILILCSFLSAQDGGTQRAFSTLGFGAKAIGMGQAFTAAANDPTAVHWNPAGLEFINQQSATFFHTTLFEGIQYDFIGYAYPTLSLGSFGFGIARLGVTGFVGKDIYQNSTSDFTGDEYQAFFSYAKKLPFNLTPGVTVRWIRNGWSGTDEGGLVGVGVGADLGLLYRPDWIGSALTQDWSFGLKVHNLFAPQIGEGDIIDEYALITKIGILKQLHFGQAGSINLMVDVNHSQSRDLKIHFGSEYSFRDMGKIRMGYNGGTLAFGAGAEYDMFEIDYGYGMMEHDQIFAATHRVSITVNFGATRNDMFQIAEAERIKEEDRIKREIREADKQEFIATHLKAADDFFAENKYLDAIVEYQQVIGTDPFHFRAGVMLDSSNALLQNDFYQRQTIAVQNALDKEKAESDRMFVQQHFNKGRLLLDQKQFVEAMIEFNIALEREPGNQTLQNSISTTRRRIGEEVGTLVQKSRDEFQNKNYSEALRLLADARLLGADDAQLQNEVETLASRIKLQDNLQQGLLLYEVGNYNEALQVLEEALKLDPENNLVKQYYERSRLETVSSEEEMDPESQKKYLLGVNTFLSGKYAEAIKIWEEILKDHPYNKRVLESIKNARDRLANIKK